MIYNDLKASHVLGGGVLLKMMSNTQHIKNFMMLSKKALLQLRVFFLGGDMFCMHEFWKIREQATNNLVEAAIEYGYCLHGAINSDASSEAIKQLECKLKKIENIYTEIACLEDQWWVFETAAYKSLQTLRSQENAMSECYSEVSNAEKELDKACKQRSPAKGTLLYFLKMENSNVFPDIANIIRSDMLDRTDLNPCILDSNKTILGLSLDLEKVNFYPYCDVDVAIQEVEVAEIRMKNAQSELNKSSLQLLQLKKIYESVEADFIAHKLKLQNLRNKLQYAHAEVDDAKSQVESSKIKMRTQAKKLLETSEIKLQVAKESIAMEYLQNSRRSEI
jgi:hypothetical protein